MLDLHEKLMLASNRIAELEADLKRERHVRETAERESMQHAERTMQLHIERDAATSELAAARKSIESLEKLVEHLALCDREKCWTCKNARLASYARIDAARAAATEGTA